MKKIFKTVPFYVFMSASTFFLLIVIASLSASLSRAQTQKSMTAKQITIRDNQVEINYFQQGKGDTTLLFLHGWCIDGTYWKNQSDYFSKNYNVYAIDIPGFGKPCNEHPLPE